MPRLGTADTVPRVRSEPSPELHAKLDPLPFLGREAECRALGRALEEALQGRTRLALVSGEAGIGKSRLVEDLRLRATTHGIATALGRCHDGDGAPAFWPWTQVLRGLARESRADLFGGVADDVARIVPELAQAGSPSTERLPSDASDARFRVFAAVGEALRRAARDAPRLIVLEDVHWADVPSLLLLQFLAREIQDVPLLVVATHRELAADHALQRPLTALAREPLARRIELRGLAATDVAGLVAASAGADHAGALAEDLARRTGGNPFFVGELLRFASRSGGLERLAAGQPLPFLPEINAVVAERLEQVSPDCRGLLRAATVIGEEFALELLLAATSLDAADALRLLDEALDARLVAEGRTPGQFAFVHALVRDALYASLSLTKRTEVHRRIGEAIEVQQREHSGETLAELAHHFVAAAASGTAEQAVDYARRAGDWAMARLAYEDAAARYQQALDVFALRRPRDERLRASLLLALADAASATGDLERAGKVCEQVATIAQALNEPALLLESVLHAEPWWGVRGLRVDPVQITRLESGLAALPADDSPLRALAMAHLAYDVYVAGQLERGQEIAHDATVIARRLGDSHVLLRCLRAQLVVSLGPHQSSRRIAIASEMVDVARSAGDLEMACLAGRWLLLNLFEIGDVAGVERELEQCTELAARLAQPSLTVYVRGVHTLRQILAGELPAAEAALVEMLQAATNLGGREVIGIQLALLRVVQGRWDDVRTLVELTRGRFARFTALNAALLLADAESGRLDEARAALDAFAAHDFEDLPRDFLWMTALVLLATVCLRLDDRARAKHLYDLLLPFAELNVIANPGGWFCWGSAHGALGALAATCGDDDTAERHLERAIAENHRLGARVWAISWQQELAALRLERGRDRDGRAREQLTQALAAAEQIGMQHVAARARESLARSDAGEAAAASVTPSTGMASSTAAVDRATLRHEGDFWTLGYAGEDRRIRDLKGLHYIAHLIRHAGREFHVLDLTSGGPGGDRASLGSATGTGAVLDGRAKADYRRRLADLAEELAEAEADADTGRIARLRDEIDALTDQLSSAIGLGGRDRQAGAAAERARSAVTQSIRSAIKRIEGELPRLATRLQARVRTGTFCSYEPDPERPLEWTL